MSIPGSRPTNQQNALQMADEESTKTVRSAAGVMVATLGSRLLGFVRIGLIGAVFGASGDADVLNLVFNIPNNLRKLLAEGALSSAFIPVLSSNLVRDDTGVAARQLVSRLLGLQFLILVPLLILATVFAQPIVNFILDFPEIERQFLAARLFRFLIHYLLLISVSAVIMGTLNSHHRFLVPSVSPLLFSVSVITSIFVFRNSLGIFSVAVGVLAGGVGQILLQLPLFRKLGYTLKLSFDFSAADFRTVVRRWLPVVSTAGIFTINQQIAMFFASGLEDGSGSALTNALVFWQLPFGIFAASVTTVLFPTLSKDWEQQNLHKYARTIRGGLTSLLLLLIPSAAGLIVLGAPIIAVALQRGEFLLVHTRRAANVLTGYSWGLFSVGAYTFMQRVFYAGGDYRTPIWIAAVTLVVDVVLSLWLKETSLRVAGLSLANSIAFSVGLVLFLMSLSRRLNGLNLRKLLPTVVVSMFASGTAVAAVVGAKRIGRSVGIAPDWWASGSSWQNFGLLMILATVGLITVYSVYRISGIDVKRLIKRRAIVE